MTFENNGRKYYYGALIKAKPDATVKVMSSDYKQAIKKEEPDMLIGRRGPYPGACSGVWTTPVQ
ncbi:MAG: hypothetical protein LBG57_14195 [Treponema sp.]|nr:hypothetical protein [Treponema sp.]